MSANNPSIQEISKTVAQEILKKLNLEPNAFLDSLVDRISKDIVGKFKPSQNTSQQTSSPKSPAEGNIFSAIKSIPDVIKKAFESASGSKSQLEAEEKPLKVLIDGFTLQGYKDFLERWPNIISDKANRKNHYEEQRKNEKDKSPSGGGLLAGLMGLLGGLGAGALMTSIMPILGGAGAILGGLAALVGAFKADGPMKGILETIGKTGLKGGLAAAAKLLFGTALKTTLKRVPILGTILSYGFAWQRFQNGDKIGGIIDLVSGTVGLLDLVAPGLGTVLSLGVDIIQSILDVQAGGSNEKASNKKGDILKGWALGLKNWAQKNLRNVPIIGPLIKAVEHFDGGEWSKGFKQLAYMFPGIELLAAFLGDEETGAEMQWIASGTKKLMDSFKTWAGDKLVNSPLINGLINSVKGAGDFIENMFKSLLQSIVDMLPEDIGGVEIRSRVAGWLGLGPKMPETSNDPGVHSDVKGRNKGGIIQGPKPALTGGPGVLGDAAIDPNGGLLVSSPKVGSLYQLHKQDGIIAGPFGSGNSKSLAKTEAILERIAINTSSTTQNVSNLIAGFNNLAKALVTTLGDSVKIPSVVAVNGNQMIHSSSQIAQAGNADITNFRIGTIERSRFQTV